MEEKAKAQAFAVRVAVTVALRQGSCKRFGPTGGGNGHGRFG